MTLAQQFSTELQQQAVNTRKLLERIPNDKLTWKPHEKSTPIGRLGMHIAEIPGYITRAIQTQEFDFAATPFKPVFPNSNAEIIDTFEKTLAVAVETLKECTDDQLSETWTARRGEQIISKAPKREVIRRALDHVIHHRGQLTVYLRLLNIPVPPTFGPTADER